MLRPNRWSDLARYSAFYNMETSISNGANEIFVDSIQIPGNMTGYLLSLNQGHPSQMVGGGVALGAFLCDETMTNGFNPLLPNGALDPNKIGPGFLFIGNATGDDVNFFPGNNANNFRVPLAIIPSGWFIRFSTYLGPGVFPGAGDFTRLRLQLACVPSCDGVC